MAIKNIQLKNKLGELLNPKTVSRNVIDEYTGKSVYDTLRSLTSGDGWKDLTLINGFTVYNPTDRVMVKKIGGVVYLAGTVKNGTSNIIANLPSIYRPGQVIRTNYLNSKGSGYCSIDPEGNIALNGYSGGGFDFGSIDGIVYSL